MLEGVRSKIMCKIRERFAKGYSWEGIVTENIKKKLVKIVATSRQCTIFFVGGMEFEVKDGKGVSYVVNLTSRKCVCNSWKISSLPCKHTAAAISYMRGNIKEYCDVAFTNESHQLQLKVLFMGLKLLNLSVSHKSHKLGMRWKIKLKGEKEKLQGGEGVDHSFLVSGPIQLGLRDESLYISNLRLPSFSRYCVRLLFRADKKEPKAMRTLLRLPRCQIDLL
ncbi:hypothetical protein F0562_011309 [Nyssa sinensis]|uniref:SWIM-type domain-containing protein n=1 Tax=Nyssa sinensis TaxID=561372 RepID=A0A5J5A4D6_9ASTE|nr:hypothetical protein F0562_011309 [Nyssa sinensis]